jgi:hypothetical protein
LLQLRESDLATKSTQRITRIQEIDKHTDNNAFDGASPTVSPSYPCGTMSHTQTHAAPGVTEAPSVYLLRGTGEARVTASEELKVSEIGDRCVRISSELDFLADVETKDNYAWQLKIEADTAKATYELELAKFAQAEYQAQRCMDATKASLLELEAVVLRQCHGRTMSQTQRSDALHNDYNKAKSKKDAINSQKQGLKADVEKAEARLFGALLDVQLLRRHVTEHVKSTNLRIRREHTSAGAGTEAVRLGEETVQGEIPAQAPIKKAATSAPVPLTPAQHAPQSNKDNGPSIQAKSDCLSEHPASTMELDNTSIQIGYEDNLCPNSNVAPDVCCGESDVVKEVMTIGEAELAVLENTKLFVDQQLRAGDQCMSPEERLGHPDADLAVGSTEGRETSDKSNVCTALDAVKPWVAAVKIPESDSLDQTKAERHTAPGNLQDSAVAPPTINQTQDLRLPIQPNIDPGTDTKPPSAHNSEDPGAKLNAQIDELERLENHYWAVQKELQDHDATFAIRSYEYLQAHRYRGINQCDQEFGPINVARGIAISRKLTQAEHDLQEGRLRAKAAGVEDVNREDQESGFMSVAGEGFSTEDHRYIVDTFDGVPICEWMDAKNKTSKLETVEAQFALSGAEVDVWESSSTRGDASKRKKIDAHNDAHKRRKLDAGASRRLPNHATESAEPGSDAPKQHSALGQRDRHAPQSLKRRLRRVMSESDLREYMQDISGPTP